MPRAEPGLVVEQFIPTLALRDAVGNVALRAAEAMLAAGIENRVWFGESHGVNGNRFQPFTRFRPRPDSVLLYQASTGARDMVEALLGRPEPLGLWYHNITPAPLSAPYDAQAALSLQGARSELALLAGRTRLAIADSRYNALELEELGVRDVRVVPPFPMPAGAQPDAELARRLRASGAGRDVLFVGRIVPSKAVHALLPVMALVRASSPGSRLFVVGATGPWTYVDEIERTRARLRLDCVHFTGPLSDAQLAAHFETASLYLTLSEHEGFGVPLVEAMARGLPVVARDAGATAETLGGAGIVLHDQAPELIAEVVLRVLSDGGLRARLGAAGRRRAAEIEAFPREAAILEAVRDLAGL